MSNLLSKIKKSLQLKQSHEATDNSSVFEAFLQSIPMEYCGWNNHGVQVISPKLERILGHTPIQNFEDLKSIFVKKDAERLDEAFQKLKQDKKKFQITLYSKDCVKVYKVSGTAGNSFDGDNSFFVLWFLDATEEEHKNIHAQEKFEKFKNTEELCQSIFQAMPFPVWVRDETLKIIWCNKAYSEIFDTSIKSVLDHQYEILPKELAREIASKVSGGMKSIAVKEYVIIKGERRYVEVVEKIFVGQPRQFGYLVDMTKLETMEEELKKLSSANSQVLEQINTPVAIFKQDMTLEFFNSAYNNLWGLPENWLNTKPSLLTILDRMRQNRKLPERVDFKTYIEEWRNHFHTVLESHEEMMYLPDGTALRMVIVPHPDGGIMVSYEDVTSRLELESSYNTLIAVQRETIDHLAESVSVFGADGRLKLYNTSYKAIWGLRDEQLATLPHVTEVVDMVKRFFKQDNWAITRQKMIDSCLRRESNAGQFDREDGTILEYTLVPLPDGGLLCSYVDVTDTVKVEAALREKNAALEEAEKLKSGFLANVSYQLRTPLNAIMGFSDILGQEYFGPLNQKQKEYTSGMLEAGNKLVKLIDDILDLATIEAGYLSLDIQEIQVSKLMDDMKALTSDWADAKSLKMEFVYPSNIGTLEADERRVKQVLVNLIQNAIHFTDISGEIKIEATKDKDMINLSVTDNGVGIAPEDIERVFQPFRRTKSSSKQGAGIGLSLVKSIVELHGGSITIESNETTGTKVVCSLPIHAAQIVKV